MKTEITGNRFVKNTQHSLKITDLGRVNILFGKNGTGKSTFLRNVYQAQSNDFHLVVPERGGGNMLYQSNIFDQENKEEIDKIKTNKKSTKISKDLIKKIHHKIDTNSNTTDWKIRVGKVLGKGRPTGELRDFLGKDVVDYIWGKVITDTK